MQNNQRNPDIQVSHQAKEIRKTAVKAVVEAMEETMEVAEGEALATSAIQEVDRKRSHQQSKKKKFTDVDIDVTIFERFT